MINIRDNQCVFLFIDCDVEDNDLFLLFFLLLGYSKDDCKDVVTEND